MSSRSTYEITPSLICEVFSILFIVCLKSGLEVEVRVHDTNQQLLVN